MADIKELAELVAGNWEQGWSDKAREILEGVKSGARYSRAEKASSIRSPGMTPDGTHIPYAAYINPNNPDSGAYGGTSFVLFPFNHGHSLISFVVGTQGLAPDERILGRPGHSRKVAAACKYINEQFGKGKRIAWSKSDPCRTDISIPDSVAVDMCPCEEQDGDIDPEFSAMVDKYGNVLYATVNPKELSAGDIEIVLKILLDIYFEEYGIKVKGATNKKEYEKFKRAYQGYLFPKVEETDIKNLLDQRKFVIVEGPPGTGKTRLATKLYDKYAGHTSVQFHPNMTYEQFVGGLFPIADGAANGFTFKPHPGSLMTSVINAKGLGEGQKYLLHIDEINRADLSRVLGEAIMLFEPKADTERAVDLNYDFDGVRNRKLSVPQNLHVIGTMNSADRSIAILDIAIRRRFAFVRLYPQMDVVESLGDDFSKSAFSKLLSIFVEKATDENFKYMPGHSYFIKSAGASDTKQQILTELLPLLQEYIEQGYVSGFADDIRAYIQEYEILCKERKA